MRLLLLTLACLFLLPATALSNGEPPFPARATEQVAQRTHDLVAGINLKPMAARLKVMEQNPGCTVITWQEVGLPGGKRVYLFELRRVSR